MAQIAITLAPTLVTSLSLTGAGSTVTVSEPTAGVMTILSEVLRGEQGIQGPAGDQGIQGIQGIQGPQGDQGPPAPDVHAAAAKAMPDDADEIGVMDSAASWVLKKVTWANIKAAMSAWLNTQAINLAITWNNVATTFTALKVNVTNTASAAGSLLMDLQIGGVSKFKVDKLGAAVATSISASSAAVGGAAGFNGSLLVKGGLGFDGNAVIRQATNADGYTLQFWGTKVVISDSNSGSYSYAGAAMYSGLSNLGARLFVDFGSLYATPNRFQVGSSVTGNDTWLSLNDGTGIFGAGVHALWGSSAAGKIGVYMVRNSVSARLHIGAGTAAAGTAPLKLSTGVNLTTPESGAFEFDGTNLYFTVGGVRKTVTLV